MENLEMSEILTAVSKILGILLKVRQISMGSVRRKIL